MGHKMTCATIVERRMRMDRFMSMKTKKATYSIPTIRKMLGLGKTESYWLMLYTDCMHNSQEKNGKYYRKERDSIWR